LVYRDLLVNHALTPSGYKPLTAKDGEMGLRVAQQEESHLIVLPAASSLYVQAPVE